MPHVMRSSPMWKVVALLAVPCGTASCDHELETICVTGDNCADYAPPQAEVNLPGCLEGCDTTTPSGNTGEFPCEVEPIIAICSNCHTDGGIGPFHLETYEDSQQLFGANQRAVYALLVPQVSKDLMPRSPTMPLTDEQKTALLDDWACDCAPPRAENEECE